MPTQQSTKLGVLSVQAIAGGELEDIQRVEQRHISVGEAKASREVFLAGSSLPIMPVVQVRECVWGAVKVTYELAPHTSCPPCGG